MRSNSLTSRFFPNTVSVADARAWRVIQSGSIVTQDKRTSYVESIVKISRTLKWLRKDEVRSMVCLQLEFSSYTVMYTIVKEDMVIQ